MALGLWRRLDYMEAWGVGADLLVGMVFKNAIVLNFAAEEYHPRWGARTSNPVKSVNYRLGGFNSCLFRQISFYQPSPTFTEEALLRVI